MSVRPVPVFSFPEEFPNLKVGILFTDEQVLITGHDNGFVVKVDLASGKYEIIHECSSSVEAISKSPDGEVAVGCNSGLLFTFTLRNPEIKNVIQEAENTKFSRIWRLTWPSKDNLLVASTYGVLNLFTRTSPSWSVKRLEGHNDSIFGLDCSNNKLLVSGDWTGKIIIRRNKESEYNTLDTVDIQSVVEGISCHRDGAFAAIDEYGHINFFESDEDTQVWKSVFEIDAASSPGLCITMTDDGKSIFAGTHTELIQFDIDTQQVRTQLIHNIRAIFAIENDLFMLANQKLLSMPRSKIDVPISAVKYQYSKVSLIGHTGAGKTTLCSLITSGSTADIKSTFGKRIWNWNLSKTDAKPERRVILHDHGGQETVLDTFLPFLADSDVALIFFKKTDRSTFEKALKIHSELQSIVTPKTKIFFVETFIDHEMDDIDRERLASLINRGTITACLSVSPATHQGLDTFKQELTNEIDWNNAKTMIRSENVESLEKSISAHIENKTSVVRFQEFKQFHEKNSERSITTSHLKFLLSHFSRQGSIEYYPDVVDVIIFNDEKYNMLRTKIPIEAGNRDGIISFKYIQTKFGYHDYIKMLDRLYITYGLAVENDDLRIFPGKLKKNVSNIGEPYRSLLQNPRHEGEASFRAQEIKVGSLIRALSELKLVCIDASIREGIFAWEKNACIYYSYKEAGNFIKGQYLTFSYMIGGENESISNRLYNEFQTVIEHLYGQPLSDPTSTKKKDLKNIKFDVALSFAGEQRSYVEKIANYLGRKGINVFYDEFYQSHLWGKDLAEYLQKIFSENAKWCMMFISQEYVSKIWPTHERKSALAKQVTVKGGYILPVRFDDTEVPGLNKTIGYQDARIKSPEQIAELFLSKSDEVSE